MDDGPGKSISLNSGAKEVAEKVRKAGSSTPLRSARDDNCDAMSAKFFIPLGGPQAHEHSGQASKSCPDTKPPPKAFFRKL